MRLTRTDLIRIFTLAILLTPRPAAAQDITDTLFYDIKWQLCERIPASYYRIGTMRIDSLARYTGPATDYYINGQLEMKATYNQTGEMEGEAIFYYSNGNTRMKGHFTAGQMTGQWFFYNETGVLRAILDCKDETNFTPLFLSNRKGKVLLKDGNDKFSLNTEEFADIMYPSGYEIEGQVRNGLKDGTWNYSTDISFPFNRGRSHRTFIAEQYVRGRFIRAVGDPDDAVKDRVVLNKPFSKITLYRPKLLALDLLKSDFVFAPTKDKRHQLKAFLVTGRTPVIEEAPASPDQNFALFLRVICNALMKKEELAYKGHSLPGKSYAGSSYQIIRLGQHKESIRYAAHIRFTIQPDRTPGNLVIEGKIDNRSRDLITHYLLKLRNLYVSEEPAWNNIDLTLQTTSAVSEAITVSRSE